MSKTFSFFLGCLIPNRFPELEKASRFVCDALDIGLEEMEGASCCPAPGVIKSFDKTLWYKVAGRNLSLAAAQGNDILVLCNGCYGTLKDVSMVLREDEGKLGMVRDSLSTIGRTLPYVPDVVHIVEHLCFDYGFEEIRKRVTSPLSANVAVHYGCHLLKPARYRGFTSFEDPTFFDELVETTGARSVPYLEKNSCCGAGGAVRSGLKDLSLDIARKKAASIKGADCIVTPCPFCHMQLMEVSEIPVIYITQLLGLALGGTPEDVGMEGPL
ncbi:CoB--CoM heterodisulfide reductase subunit B [archaeon]|nr:MAG: CoB--CoM heterodisulfide reductase subunit B [archaeon]